MKCPKCGTDLADNARFCSQCGLTLARPEEKPAPRIPRRPIIAALIAIAAIGLAAAVFSFMAPKKSSRPVAQSPSAVPAPSTPITQSPSPVYGPQRPLAQSDVPKPPAVQAPVQEQAPPEVIEYLKFVKGIERNRQEMRVDFTPAFDMMKSAYSSQLGLEDEPEAKQKEVSKGYSQYVQDWNQLLRQFDSVQAPEQCREFAGIYRQALGYYVTTMTKIQIALAQNDINTLVAMKSKAQVPIDESLRQSDAQLEKLTKRYNLEKDFSITPDREVDTLFGM